MSSCFLASLSSSVGRICAYQLNLVRVVRLRRQPRSSPKVAKDASRVCVWPGVCRRHRVVPCDRPRGQSSLYGKVHYQRRRPADLNLPPLVSRRLPEKGIRLPSTQISKNIDRQKPTTTTTMPPPTVTNPQACISPVDHQHSVYL